MATIQEVYDEVKDLRGENSIQHRELFNGLGTMDGRVARLEIAKAHANGHREEKQIHRREDNGEPHKHARTLDPGAWKEKLLIAGLAAMAGDHVIRFVLSLWKGAP